MKNRKGKGLIGLVLMLVLLTGLLVLPAHAAETGGRFILVAEAGGKLVIAPEYVSYAPGSKIRDALGNSGHNFIGLEQGIVTAINDVSGSFSRSDQTGSYDLTIPASSVTHYRFSENSSGSQPSEGLMKLMTAMADYLEKDEDVRNAAKDVYQNAYSNFVGITSANAAFYAEELNKAVQDYENAQNGTKYTVTFTDGGSICSAAGYSIEVVNAFGKTWTDDNEDGKLQLPAGDYSFHVHYGAFHAQGEITVSGNQTVAVSLPKNESWLNTSAFRLSGSYTNGQGLKFEDAEFALGSWQNRSITVPVLDSFTGAVYAYAEYNKSIFTDNVPTLTAVYTMRNAAGTDMEKKIPFESYKEGAFSVLTAEAQGNTVIYRISSKAADGYTYSQDYTVVFDRIPTLKSITLRDQNGTDLAASDRFRSDITEYDYNVLDSVTQVTVTPEPSGSDYLVSIENASDCKVVVAGETTVIIRVSANDYSNTYMLKIHPGMGSLVYFACEPTVTIEVVNQNGVVMPWTYYKGSNTKNRYQYTLVPGDQYSYVATYNQYYHIANDFTLEKQTGKTISVSFDTMDDWLGDLSFGDKKNDTQENRFKLDSAFEASDHSYVVTLEDTKFDPYIWVTRSGSDANIKIEVFYNQLFNSVGIHGVPVEPFELKSGNLTGTPLTRFLMQNNPFENTVTVRLSKEEDGVLHYQDYVTEFKRSLTLKGLTAECDGVKTVLKRPNGKQDYITTCKEYNITVSMAAKQLVLYPTTYSDNLAYGETDAGYRIQVNGKDVASGAPAVIELDGTINTQKVTVCVSNSKAPQGTTEYLVNIQKSPPVEAEFNITPSDALLHITENLSGSRIWPDEDGRFQLCEGYDYDYMLTQYGYVSKSGTLKVTRNADKELVIMDGAASYKVEATPNGGGAVIITWELDLAPRNSAINASISAMWPNFRGNDENNAVSSAPIPTAAEDGTLYWATKLGQGFDSDAVGSPILVDGDIITYASDKIYRVDTVTGQIKKTGQMDHKSSFSITPPTYAEGMVFVALSDGTVQAFNAVTLESLWVYEDPLRGQPNCPITVVDGYLYTGFWNQETRDANFVCLSITDENPGNGYEHKCASWYYTSKGGYYWAGACVQDGYVLVGSDDGTNYANSQTSRLLMLDAKTGKLMDSWDNLNGDIRSTVVYDGSTDAYYFTSKGGSFYGVRVSDGQFYGGWSLALQNGTNGIPMSTSSPSVYNGRAYVGVSGEGQFSAYSGHNITVIDLNNRRIAYTVPTQGYPQTSGLLTTAYEDGVYVYFFDNDDPGKLRALRDRPGQASPDYTTKERGVDVAYALFTPTGEHAQYAICSPIVDEYGTVYFKNDSAHLMAFGSAVASIEVTNHPDRMTYVEGTKLDPTGMKVTATYVNGLTRDVSQYITVGDKVLTAQDPTVTISFPYGLYHNEPGEGGTMQSGVKTLTPTVELTVTVTGATLGDVNGDKAIDNLDARMILDYEAKQANVSISAAAADVSGDGIVDSNDAVLILQYAEKKITKFPAASAASIALEDQENPSSEQMPDSEEES